jgi:hypothetical protein
MDLAKIVRSAVKTADAATASLQVDVTHYAWLGQSGYGDITYASPVTLPALVDQRLSEVRTASGELVNTKAHITFIRVVPPSGGAGRNEPIDARDKIVLPDGTTGPIVATSGLVDPSTARPYVLEVFLG